MSYQIIQPPFTLRFAEMSKPELRAYAAWFHEVMPDRIEELARFVRATPGFEGWKADLSVESLNPLGEWFEGQVQTRPRTPEEIAEVLAGSPHPIDVPADDLTNQTFSLAYDIGFYLSQVFLAVHPQLRWEQPLGGKRNVNYGQPVLMGFGKGFEKVPFNPVRMVVTLAYALVDQTRDESGLRRIFDIWSQKVES